VLDTINVVAQEQPGVACLSSSPPSKDFHNLFVVARFVKIIGQNNICANPGLANKSFLRPANPREGRIGDVVKIQTAVIVVSELASSKEVLKYAKLS
jgi:hypothetical protein